MTIAEVKDYISKEKDSKEVKELLASFTVITPESVGKFLESDEGFKALRPHFDRYAERAIKTHDEKKKEEIEAEISKRAAELGKKDKMTMDERMSALEAERAREREELAHERTIGKLRTYAASLGFKELEDVIDLDNPKLTLEKGKERLDARKKAFEEHEIEIANKLLPAGFKPGSGAGSGNNGITIAQLRKMTQAEVHALGEERVNEILTAGR